MNLESRSRKWLRCGLALALVACGEVLDSGCFRWLGWDFGDVLDVLDGSSDGLGVGVT